MSVANLLDQFPLLATAPVGVKRLRELILELAVRGKLIEGQSTDQWDLTTLAELGEWGSGGTPLKGNPDFYGGGIPWLVIGDLNDGLVTTSATTISEKGLENSSAKRIPPGTLLIAMYGSIGKLGITGFECTTNQAIAHCKPTGTKVDSRFLFYFLKAIRERLISKGQGLAQQNISQKILKAVEVQLPPLAEQHRIVAKVDELMALCDRLEAQQADAASAHATLVKTLLDTLTQSQSAADFAANWQRIAQHFDTLFTTEASIDALKQTLLQLAVMGKLVPQDPSDEPASALLKRIQAEKAKLVTEGKIRKDKPLPEIGEEEQSFDLPEGWEWVRFESVTTTRLGKMLDKAKNRGQLKPYLRNTNVQWGRFELDDIKELRLEEDELQELRILEGDLLICEGGEPGRSAIWRGERAEMYFQKALHRARPLCGVMPEYLQYCLRVDATSGLLGKYFTGATIKHFPGDKLARYVVSLPPVGEQHRIVARVDELMALCDQLATRLKDASELAAHYASAATEAALEAA